MRYFWHALIAIGFLALIVFVFFLFSLNRENRITFTDDLPELTEPTVTIADPILGAEDATVTIVNFGDYQCQACGEIEETLAEVIQEYPDDVRVVWKDMPNSTSHAQAINAAIAARCAAKQDAFDAYHAYLFANQSQLDDEIYMEIARTLDLKERAFQNCFEDQDTLPLVQRSYEEGLALDVTATPTIFINGERFTGTLSKNQLIGAIEAALHAL